MSCEPDPYVGRDHRRGPRTEIRIGDDWLVDWASCNYLGLDLDP